jgi:hypothetical protein
MNPTKKVIRLASNIGCGCPEKCGQKFRQDEDGFPDLVTHLLQVHEYKIQHIGQETITGTSDGAVQITVAYLGAP